MAALTHPVCLIEGSVSSADEDDTQHMLWKPLPYKATDRVATHVRQVCIHNEALRLKCHDPGETILPIERDMHLVPRALEGSDDEETARGALIDNLNSRTLYHNPCPSSYTIHN